MGQRVFINIQKKIRKNSRKIQLVPKWRHWSDGTEGVDKYSEKIRKKFQKNTISSEMGKKNCWTLKAQKSLGTDLNSTLVVLTNSKPQRRPTIIDCV